MQCERFDAFSGFAEKAFFVASVNGIRELTAEPIHEYIEKIIVYAPKQIDGKRAQLLDIYFNGVDIVQPMTPEEMEEAFQKRLKIKTV